MGIHRSAIIDDADARNDNLVWVERPI